MIYADNDREVEEMVFLTFETEINSQDLEQFLELCDGCFDFYKILSQTEKDEVITIEGEGRVLAEYPEGYRPSTLADDIADDIYTELGSLSWVEYVSAR